MMRAWGIRFGAVATLAVAIAAGSVEPVVAQDALIVSTAENDTASVLRVDIGASPFSVVKSGAGEVDLLIADSRRPFSLDGVDAARPARWISSITQLERDDGIALRLQLDCVCETETRVSAGVLSVLVRAPADGSAIDIALDRTGRASGGTKHAPRRAPSPPARPLAVTAAVGSEDQQSVSSTAPAVDAARASLLKQLVRAADQGLLTFDPHGSDAGDPEADPPTDAVAEDVDPIPSTDDATLTERLAAVDDMVRVRAPAVVSATPRVRARPERRARCPGDDRLKLPAALKGEAFARATHALKKAIADERGELNFATLERLARHYIATGFGAEAEGLIDLAVAAGAASEAKLAPLLEMARYVERAEPASSDYIDRRRHCGGDFLLWAEALRERRGGAPAEEVADIPEALDRASPGLRALIGADLISASLRADDAATARAIDEILRRTPVEESDAIAVQRALIELRDGDAATGRVRLAKVARREGEDARRALALLSNDYGAGNTPPDTLIHRLSDAAALTRSGEMRFEMTAAHIRLVALADGADAAFEAVARARGERRLSASEAAEIAHVIFEQAPQPQLGDAARIVEFARTALRYGDLISERADGDAARARVASFLNEAGFAALAQDMIAPVAGRSSPALDAVRADLEEVAGAATDASEPNAEEGRNRNGAKAPSSRASSADPAPAAAASGEEAIGSPQTTGVEAAAASASGPGAARALIDEADERLSAAARAREAIQEALNEDG